MQFFPHATKQKRSSEENANAWKQSRLSKRQETRPCASQSLFGANFFLVFVVVLSETSVCYLRFAGDSDA